MQIGYVGEEQVKLFLPECIVVIDGMYLRDLRKKLARRQITFIQQFSPKVWPDMPPKSESSHRENSSYPTHRHRHTQLEFALSYCPASRRTNNGYNRSGRQYPRSATSQ